MSIGSDDNFDQQILIDHVPHNDNAETTDMHAIEVEIPDIDCPKCSIQVLNIMTDKIGEQGCTYPGQPGGAANTIACPSVYHTCANVIITGSIPAAEYTHELETICGPYAPGTALEWSLDNNEWVSPDFDIDSLPDTFPLEMCTAEVDDGEDGEDGEEEEEEEDVDLGPQKRLAHMIRAASAIHAATATLEDALEEEYADWGMDTNDADEALNGVQDGIACTTTECTLTFDVEFDVDAEIASEDDRLRVCTSIYEHFSSSDKVTGEWACTLTVSAKRAVSYDAALTYREPDSYIDDDTEALFLISLFAMATHSGGFEDNLETEYEAWDLDLHDVDMLFFNFADRYSCGHNRCEIPLVLNFTIANTTFVLLEDDESKDMLCASTLEYWVTSAQVTGEVTCEFQLVADTDYLVTITYSEGDGGLSPGAIAGIVIGSILLFLLILILLAVLLTGGTNKEDRV